MNDPTDSILDAVTLLLPRLLGTLDALGTIARLLHPPHLPALLERLAGQDVELRAARAAFQAAPWPDHLADLRGRFDEATDLALRACTGLRDAARAPDGRSGAFRALRHATRAQEALYPLATVLPMVSRWFLPPDRCDDADLLARLHRATPRTGILHAGNDRGTRGGFSVYVPESYDPARRYPLVMALHGGAGHGRLFLWTWLREARARDLILVAPTATGSTWSLTDPAVDTAHLDSVLAFVRERWRVDPDRMLLTGLSDGGTFTLLSGLAEDSPFTHLAPAAASFHPLLLSLSDDRRLRGLPVYLMHGALDWMFPIRVGRDAAAALKAAGAAVNWREIADLSHAWPAEENGRIAAWLRG
jgi:phospholipase/carboxylesterase